MKLPSFTRDEDGVYRLSVTRLTYGAFGDGIWFFRIAGYGIHVGDSTNPRNPRLFSERYGYRRVIHLGKYRIKWLRRHYS